MSAKQLPGRRHPTESWAGFLVLSAAFIALTVSQHWKTPGIGGFLLLCAVACFRPRLMMVSFAALLGPLIGSSTWPQAGTAVGLLLLGPLTISLCVALVGAARMLWARDDTAFGRSATVRVIRPWVQGIVIGGLLLGGFQEGGLFAAGATEVGALVVPLLAYWRSYYKVAVVTGVAAAWLTGWTIAPLALAGVSLIVAAYLMSTARLPRQWHPLPPPSVWRHPAQWVRCLLCDREIDRSDILRARRWVSSGSGPWVQYRAAFLDLEERLYQPALSFGRDIVLPPGLAVPGQILRARGLSGTAQYDQARELYVQALSVVRSSRDRLYDYLILLLAENDLAAGKPANAVESATWLVEQPSSTCDYFMRQRALRILAQHELDQGNTKQASQITERALDELIQNKAVGRLVLKDDPGKLVRRMYGNRGSMYVQLLRVDALDHTIRPTRKGERDGWDPEAAALAMSMARYADDLVELYLGQARNAVLAEERSTALSFAARALMELDRTRYLLAAQSSRTSWSTRFRRVLDFALDTAHVEEDHEFVAELLEFARVQTLPAATAEGSTDLALSVPPIVLVNGRSRLARPGEEHRPPHVTLQRAAEQAAGSGAWWLSFWNTDDWLYWALADPSGTASSGRISFAVGSPFRQLLDDLERALPVLLPGEDLAEADFRLAASPLLTDPPRERALSTALGDMLLPTTLVQAAVRRRAREGTRLPLAIAPTAALGYIPWSILVADNHHAADPDRLIDVCDWVLAPSAALLCNAVPSPRRRAPLALAVADTTNDPSLGELPGAREQATALPATVRVLGGRHWSSDPATLSRLEQALRAVGPETTVAFMCHAVRGSADQPSRGGLVLAPDLSDHSGLHRPTGAQPGPPGQPCNSPEHGSGRTTTPRGYEILTPQAIFAMNKRGLTMPSQVILQACDTSALKDATSGEWLTIAPAFISAGAREVVATVYPLPDLPGIDDPITAAALHGDSLQAAVARAQREGLVRWTSGQYTEPAHTPFAWGAYATVAVAPSARTNTVNAPVVPAAIAASLMRILIQVVKACLRTRGKRIDSGLILAELLDSEDLSDLLDGGTSGLAPAALVWTIGPELCIRYFHIRDRGNPIKLTVNDTTIKVSPAVVDALRTGRATADRDGLALTAHHIVTALLGKPTAARRIVTLLTTLTRKRPALIQRAIDFRLTSQVSKRLKIWETPAWADKNRDLAEALLNHIFATADDPQAGSPRANERVHNHS